MYCRADTRIWRAEKWLFNTSERSIMKDVMKDGGTVCLNY